jgi:hypothetical protein
MHEMRDPSVCTITQKLDAARLGGAASRPNGAYLPLTFFKNGISLATKSFFGLAELGSLCE